MTTEQMDAVDDANRRWRNAHPPLWVRWKCLLHPETRVLRKVSEDGDTTWVTLRGPVEAAMESLLAQGFKALR